MPPEKIRVVPNGVDPDTRPAGAARADRAERRRARAAQADRRAHRGSRDLLRQRPGRPAAVPADRGRRARRGRGARSRRRRGRAARSAGFIRSEELIDLYRRATLLAYPSAYEGFGLPVVEAMAHGCPVLCARNSSLIEIGGRTAIFLDDVTPEGIAAALTEIARRSRGAGRARGGRARGGRALLVARVGDGDPRRLPAGAAPVSGGPARSGLGATGAPQPPARARAGPGAGCAGVDGRTRARRCTALLVPLEPWRFYELARRGARALRRRLPGRVEPQAARRACCSARARAGGWRSICWPTRSTRWRAIDPALDLRVEDARALSLRRRVLRRDRLRVGDRARRGRR